MEHLAPLLAERTREDTEHAGLNMVRASFSKLYSVWDQLDLDAAQQTQRAKMAWTHVSNLLLEIVEEESAFHVEIQKRVQDYSRRIGDLSRALLVPAKEVSGPLVKREAVLRQELDGLSALKEKRRQAYHNLKNTVLKYLKVLDINEKESAVSRGNDPEVPTEEELQKLEQKVSSLQEEKEKRGKKLLRLKKELTTILEQTELPPETHLEEELLSGMGEEDLSDRTLAALEQSLDSARRRQEELESRKGALVKRLSLLWTALRVEEGWKVDFLSRHLDVRPSTLQSMEEEVKRCEGLRDQDAKQFAEALRAELEELWEACHVAVQQRALLRSGFGDAGHDLEKLESEVQKWRQYRDEVAHMLKKIERRQQLLDQLAAFENKVSDPNRFRNRKGHLLLEEQERKRLQKEIPTLEEDLFRDIQAYEEESGAPFLYHGGDFRVFAQNQWTERRNRKESQRLERHKQDLLKMQSELAHSSVAAKRPNPRTPQSAPCKLFKSTPEVSPRRTTPNTVDRLTSRASRRRGILKEDNGPKSPDTTTYSEFADALQGSSRGCRLQSSVLVTKKRLAGKKTPVKKKQGWKSTRSKEAPVRGRFGLPFIL